MYKNKSIILDSPYKTLPSSPFWNYDMNRSCQPDGNLSIEKRATFHKELLYF